MSGNQKGDADTDEQSSTPFERALKVWSEIALSDLQKTLDDEGVEIVEKQKASVVGRKELAGRTKEFKKLDDSEKLTEVKGLLKAYQSEIDNLTSRCKFAENCFMKLYKLLAEAPDPKPLLEASIDSVISASESSRLASENSRLNELVSKTADYDNIKSKLMKVEMQSIENAQTKVKAKESEMKALMDEKERAWKLREDELTKQVEELKANNQVTQAQLDTSSNAPADAGGRIAELELVERDLERANSRVLEMEKRNLELRGQLEEAKSETKDAEEKIELEKRISDLEGENVVLAAKIESSRKSLEQVKADNSKKVQALERDLSWKAEEGRNLKQKLAKQEDYDEIKQELDILKSIEFQEPVEETATDTASSTNESLEKKLLGRNKRLNNDLTALRVSNGELQTQIEKHQQNISTLEKELQESRDLNHKLESDISQLREASGDASGMASSISGSRSGRVSPTTSIIGGRGGDSQPAPSSRSNDKTILPIITQQRDRFRQRNHELEQELSSSWQQLTSLRKELETLKKDNLDLYEKNRYVSTYKRSNANTDVDDRYRSVYEEGLSPFQQFRGKETERAISRMGPLERVTYSFTKAVLANRLSRNLFLIYCIGLHLLIMAIMIHGVGHSPTTPDFPGEATGGIADSVLSGDSIEQAGEALAPPPGK